MKSRPMAERFWEKVNKTDGCWLWTGSKTRQGYGRINAGGVLCQKMLRANRVSLNLAGIEIPDGMLVCHRCDTPACVRPDHLYVADQSTNIRDAFRKGRMTNNHSRGEGNPAAKMTWQLVRQARRDFDSGERCVTRLGARYGIGFNAMRNIVRGVTWRERL